MASVGTLRLIQYYPDNKVHGANMGPTWVPWAPDGPHVGPMNRAMRVYFSTGNIVAGLGLIRQWIWLVWAYRYHPHTPSLYHYPCRDAVRCLYNAVNFLQKCRNMHRLARPWGPNKALYVHCLIQVLHQLLECCIQCDVILDHVLTTPNSM